MKTVRTALLFSVFCGLIVGSAIGHPEFDPYTTDLFAGQHMDVGLMWAL